MQIVFSCSSCGKKFQKDSILSGKKARCSGCGHVFVIPTPSTVRPPRGAAPVAASASSSGKTRGAAERRPSLPSPSIPDSAVDDPYGLNDVPVGPVAAPALPSVDNEYDAPVLPRRAPASSPGQKSKGSSWASRDRGSLFDGLPGFVYFGVLAVLALGFLLTLISPAAGAYLFFGGGVLSFLVLFLYGAAGVIIVPFSDGLLTGLLCWFCPFYILGYTIREWDAMKGPFLSYIASFGVVIVMAIALPGLNAMRHNIDRQDGALPAGFSGAGDPAEVPPGFLRPAPGPPSGFEPPPAQSPAPPPGVQQPVMAYSIVVMVSGLSNREAARQFADRLTELIRRVSSGYQLSNSGSGGPLSMYRIGFEGSVDVQRFADQITWARVVRVAGNSIEVDASGR